MPCVVRARPLGARFQRRVGEAGQEYYSGGASREVVLYIETLRAAGCWISMGGISSAAFAERAAGARGFMIWGCLFGRRFSRRADGEARVLRSTGSLDGRGLIVGQRA